MDRSFFLLIVRDAVKAGIRYTVAQLIHRNALQPIEKFVDP